MLATWIGLEPARGVARGTGGDGTFAFVPRGGIGGGGISIGSVDSRLRSTTDFGAPGSEEAEVLEPAELGILGKRLCDAPEVPGVGCRLRLALGAFIRVALRGEGVVVEGGLSTGAGPASTVEDGGTTGRDSCVVDVELGTTAGERASSCSAEAAFCGGGSELVGSGGAGRCSTSSFAELPVNSLEKIPTRLVRCRLADRWAHQEAPAA